MSPRLPADSPIRPIEVAIVGNDAVLAALPARPMQLAHAIHACGYDLVVPVSWGEEALAEHALRVIAARGSAPVIFCACPALRSRLLSAGTELAPYLISTVAPSVATARYLRALQPDVPLRITMIGGCPGARDASIDTRVSAHDFLRLLVNRGISLTRQPAVFDSVIPPDRRRFFSLPGGCPSPKALETRAPERRLVTITEETFSTELADLLLGRENILIDLSARLACTCCGGIGVGEHWGPAGPDEIMQYEPPRAPTPVLDLDIEVPLDLSPIEVSTPTPRSERAAARSASSETFRLPGAAPIAEARQRAERRRIAVTPPAAMPATPAPPVTSPVPDALVPIPALRAAPTTAVPTVVPTAVATSLRAATEVAAVATPRRRAAPNPEPGAPASNRDVAVDRQVQAEPGRAVGARAAGELDASGGARSPAPTTTDEGTAPRPALPAPRAASTAVAAGQVHDVPVEIPRVAVPPQPDNAGFQEHGRRTAPQRFHLSRVGPHPRAKAGSGRVLPRAYIRHTPVSTRAIEREPLAPVVDEERPLDVVIEPAPAPPADAAVGSAAMRERATQEVVSHVDASEAVAPEAPAPETPAPSPLAAEVPAAPAPAMESVRDRTVSAEDAARNEVLARVRRQAQRPTRVLVHDASPQHRRPFIGSLTFFVATAVVVVGLLVALAVLARRSPGFPF